MKLKYNLTTSNYDKDDIIGIVDVADTEKFFQVLRFELDTVFRTDNGETRCRNCKRLCNNIYICKSCQLEEANTRLFAGEFQVGELLWVDNDSTNRWIVLKNTLPTQRVTSY